jgi:hypothetical protein
MVRFAEILTFVLGPCLFALLVIGGFIALLNSCGDLKLADYLAP